MTRNRNFVGQVTPSVIDTEYESCNFSQPVPIDLAGLKRGVRLFPGDDTPRTFVRCNLVNAEVPPGSTIVGGNTTMRESNVLTGSDDIVVDGETLTIEHHSNFVHGRFDPASGSYVDLPSPSEVVID